MHSEVEEILEGFVEIGNNHPRAQAFGEAVAEQIAARPSPTVQTARVEILLEQVVDRLDKMLLWMRGAD